MMRSSWLSWLLFFVHVPSSTRPFGFRCPRLRPLSVSSSSVSWKSLPPGIGRKSWKGSRKQRSGSYILSILLLRILLILLILKMPQAPNSTFSEVDSIRLTRFPNARPPHSARSVRGHLGFNDWFPMPQVLPLTARLFSSN